MYFVRISQESFICKRDSGQGAINNSSVGAGMNLF